MFEMDFNILVNEVKEIDIENMINAAQGVDEVGNDPDPYQHSLNVLLEKIENCQVVCELKNITLLHYMMLANIKDIKVDLKIDYLNPEFKNLELVRYDLNDKFDEQVQLAKEFMNRLPEQYKPYLTTTGQLCDIVIYSNGLSFMRMIATMLNYDELTEVVDCMISRDTEGNMITNMIHLNDRVQPYTIYLEEMLGYDLRHRLMESEGSISIEFETDLNLLDKLYSQGIDISNFSTTSYMKTSLMGYIGMLEKGMSNRIKTENIYDVFNKDNVLVNILLPYQVYDREEDVFEIAKYISDWLEIINEYMELKTTDRNALYMIPVSFGVLSRYITEYKNDLNSTEEDYDLVEVGEIQLVRKSKIVEEIERGRGL